MSYEGYRAASSSSLSEFVSCLSIFVPPLSYTCSSGGLAPISLRSGSQLGMTKSITTQKTSRGMPSFLGPPPIPKRKASMALNLRRPFAL